MKNPALFASVCAWSFAVLLSAESADPTSTLGYASPATSWQTRAQPIGNGRIGAMIFGGIGRERIALNDWKYTMNEATADDR